MANTIRIKRRASGVGAGAPSGLANAELAYNEGDNILYYGFGTGGAGGTATQVIPIAGSGAYLNKNNNLSDLNNAQTSRNNLASNTVTSGLFMRGNGTNVLMGSIIASDVPTLNQNTTGSAGSVTSSLTINNGGAGDNSGSTFNGSVAKTISYNSIGSPSVSGTNATGTWNISVTGNAGTVTNGVYTSRTITPGSGLAGSAALDLSADRTFNIGQGDGITVSADSIAVDSTVVRTTGAQTISDKKLFSSGLNLGGNPLALNPTLYIRAPDTSSSSFAFQIVDSAYGSILDARNNGNISIGSFVGVNDKLNIKGSTSDSSLGALHVVNSSNSGIIFARNDGNVGVGTTNPTTKLHVNGTGLFTAGIISSGTNSLQVASTASAATQFAVFTSSPSASAQTILTRTPSEVKTDIGLTNVTNDAQIKKLASTSGGFVPTWNGTTGDALNIGYSVETTLTGGAGALPRADAVKTYVDNAVTNGFSLNDAMVFKGTIGAGGTPGTLPTGTISAGWTYRVVATGTYAGVVCEIGDLIIGVADAAGNVNSTWTVAQTNIDGAVVGPASSTTNALAVFNGTTGKLIQNSSFVPTTVGGNLINLTNPGAIRFVRINADNTVSSLSDSDFRTAIGAGTSSTVGTVTSVGGTGSVAGLTLTGTVTTNGNLTLGGTLSTPVSTINDSTTVGQNLVKLTNPGAISFLRINANNTIDALSDTNFRTAIGAYASSNPSGYTTNVGTVTSISAGSGMNYSAITSTGSVVLGTPSSITLSSTNSLTSNSHTHAFSPGGTTSQYIRGDGVATSGAALTKTDDTNVTLTIGGSPTNALLSATSLTLGWTGNLAVNRGGTAQTSYTDGQLLIGNSTGNTLTKATLTQGTNITITNGNGSITIASTDTNTATAADDILDGSNTGTQITYAPYATNQAASASPRFYNTADNPSGSGRLNVSAYFYATRLFDNGSRVVTADTICSDAGNCTWDGGSF
jgi:hypothetical protein